MIESTLRRLIEHPRRKLIVIILTILTGLVVVFPAADEYNAAKERLDVASLDLEDARGDIALLPEFERMYEEKTAWLGKLEGQAVSQRDAQSLRSELMEMVRESECAVRQIRLGAAGRRDWTTQDDAVNGMTRANRGKATPYQLETRQLTASVTGTMANLHQFLSRVHTIDKFIHTKEVALKRSEESEGTAVLDMDILLFDLVKKASK